jgi:hypothetical protein
MVSRCASGRRCGVFCLDRQSERNRRFPTASDQNVLSSCVGKLSAITQECPSFVCRSRNRLRWSDFGKSVFTAAGPCGEADLCDSRADSSKLARELVLQDLEIELLALPAMRKRVPRFVGISVAAETVPLLRVGALGRKSGAWPMRANSWRSCCRKQSTQFQPSGRVGGTLPELGA